MHVLLLALCAILVAVHGNESPQMIQAQKTFTKCALMDEANDYRLYWNLNATHVVFGLRAQVTGWIALGQSQSGHMNRYGNKCCSESLEFSWQPKKVQVRVFF